MLSQYLFVAIFLLYLSCFTVEIHSSTSPVQQQSFLRAHDETGGSLCIVDAPSSSLKVNIDKQCIVSCIDYVNCYDLNIVNNGTTGGVTCQLYIAMETVRYGVRTGCCGYQVWLHYGLFVNTAVYLQPARYQCMQRYIVVKSYLGDRPYISCFLGERVEHPCFCK